MGNKDTANPLWGLFGFFIPIAGLVLYLVWRFDRIKDGKYALYGAILGAIIQLGISILLRIFLFDFLLEFFGFFSMIAF
jgi:urea transporter